MPDNNKHKIFSKEELFKLLDEQGSLPPDADDFDREAMEGLAMLKDRNKIEGLDNSIDEVLRREKEKAKKKRSLYVLSAAASLLLLAGLFFLWKDIAFEKKDKNLAENVQPVAGNPAFHEPKAQEESPAVEKKAPNANNTVTTGTNGEASGKEGKASGGDLALKSGESTSAGNAVAAPPAEKAVTESTLESRVVNEDKETDRDQKIVDGKEYKKSLTKQDQLKKEEAKKQEGLVEDEKDKTRYLTNTVWTTTPSNAAGAADESKNKNDDYRSKDGNGITENSKSPQKSAELGTYEMQKSKSAGKKSKSKEQPGAKPDSVVTDMLAGYSYYNDQLNSKGLVQGGAPEKSQQATATPVQTQTQNTEPSGNIAQSINVPAEEKVVSDKTTTRHESQPDNTANVGPQTAVRGNVLEEPAQFVGGTAAMQQYVKKNLKISSPGKAGVIEAEFVVEQDGKIDTGSVKITTKIKNCDPCSKDVSNMVKTMPKWKPATEKGKTTNRKQKLSVQYDSGELVK
ncbi:MAG TPA: hypothetical protein VNY73_09430 [Bacteroidia bacterium]|nr:hypothetical protein [Bacteroidia bacterium]